MLGVIVGLGGVLAIWVLSSALQGEKEIIRPDNTVSYRKPLPDGATYSQLRSDGIDTLGYLAYVLDCQQFYHSESNTQSTANIFPCRSIPILTKITKTALCFRLTSLTAS